ncbi:MAG: hypothetical protein JO132_04775 [Streptosporangiaceae bacterium]|nr:hypothetical protein [Streptosporangiaceae bacterium]
MSDWDSVFGEAALGLDLAKVDPVPGGPGQAPSCRSARPSGPAQPDPQHNRSAGQAASSSAAAPAVRDARPLQATRPSLKLVSRPAAPATNPEAIFRPEALEFRVRGRDSAGSVVRLGARWVRWAYRMALALLVVAVLGMWVVHTDESASGPAVVDGRTGTVALVLPAVVGPELAGSRDFTVALPGGRSAGIVGLQARLADGAAISKAGLVPPAQPAILVTGRLSVATAVAPVGRIRTQASVVLRSESLADVLGRQFGAMLSQGTAQ